MKRSSYSISLVIILLISSCVSQKKFDELLSERVKLEAENSELLDNLTAANEKIKLLEGDVAALESNKLDNEKTIEKLDSELLH